MKMKKSDLKFILSNESGVAILMVMTAIVLLTTIMITFSFDTNVNKIKVYNMEDRGQARLTAESGLQFALARLRLYKEAFNYVEKNPSVKDFAKPDVLNSIWNFPFVYPIPVSDKMNQIQKDAIAKFEENSFLAGNLKLIITNISNKINLNMLRISLMANANINNENQNENENTNNEKDEEYAIENQIIKSLKYSVEKKSEKDDYFASLYMGFDPIQLVNVLKVNTSDPDSLTDDGGARALFDDIYANPKKAPFAIWSEVLSMPMWDDDLADLIQNEFTTHGAIMIDLNKMTEKLLRLLIPNISEDEVKEFFEWRDNPDAPKYINTLDDFKNYIVSTANIMTTNEFDERMKKFEAHGLKFGPSPSLFKVVAEGVKGRSTYTITAYVILPAKPYKAPKKEITANDKNGNGIPDDKEVPPTEDDLDGDGIPNDEDKEDNRTNTTDPTKNKQKTQLLEPRIVEIFVS